MNFFIISILVMGFMLILFLINNANAKIVRTQHKIESEEILKNLPDFNATDKYISYTSIAYDNNRKKICFIIDKNVKLYDYKDIIQSELKVNGETVSKQSGTIGRSIVGGVLGGGVGAIIGGTTGTTETKEVINSISVKITVNDTQNPLYYLFFKSSIEAERWHGIITTILKQVEIEQNKMIQSSQNSYSVADEIVKLKKLLDSEVITQAEFSNEKKKLLK